MNVTIARPQDASDSGLFVWSAEMSAFAWAMMATIQAAERACERVMDIRNASWESAWN